MNKVSIIIKKEYLERVKSKGFIISTVLIPVLFASFILIPIAVAYFSGNSVTKIAVADETGKFYAPLERALKADNENFSTAPFDWKDSVQREAVLKGASEGKLAGYLLIQQKSDGKYSAIFTAKTITDFDLTRSVKQSLKSVINKSALQEAGFDSNKIALFEKPVDFQTQKISQGKESEGSELGQFALTYVMVLLIYGTLLTYGITVMNSVLEEKTSKVMEVMVASVKPFDLLLGKVLGIGLVAVTQYAIWIVAVIGLSGASVQMASKFSFSIPALTLVCFAIYFVLGYLIFSTLYAAVGSAFENAQDAQSLQTPITMLIVVPMLVLSLVISKPDSIAAVILSMIPFFAPVLMMARISGTDVPLWQIGTSMALMVVTFYGVLQLAGKIYRIGILMYGKKPSFTEVVKWIRYS